jgi:hypothetical protein
VPNSERFIEHVRKPPPMPGEALPALEIANRDGPEEYVLP